MPFRVGDIVQKHGIRFRVQKVNGTKISVTHPDGGRILGTQSERNFELVHTDWKETSIWVIVYKVRGHDEVSKISEITEENAERMKNLIAQDAQRYTLLSSTKVTIPYKDPQ